jgi:hypothetical protein
VALSLAALPITRTLVGVALLTVFLCSPARAVPTRNRDALARAPTVSEVSTKKEFFVNLPAGDATWKEYEVFLVVREVEDSVRKGWYDFEFVGRAAVAESTGSTAHLVLYKPFKNDETRKGDHLVRTGDPLTLEEMDMMRKEVLGVLQRDKELEDLYTGLISIKLGAYAAKFETTSNTDTNKFKAANGYLLSNFGLRWWFFFNPAVGLNFEYAHGSIPTTDFLRKSKESTQTYINPGLMYRGRFLGIPAMYSMTYFINSFSTTNGDDFIIPSTYTGANLGMTFYFPYRAELIRLGKFALAFNNAELGGGYAPSVSVSDGGGFSRGTKSAASQLSANAGLEFGLIYRPWRFTNDVFIVFEGGLQRFDLNFSGATKGFIEPMHDPIPQGTHNVETQSWFGIRLKYNMPDYIGELIYGL